LPLDRVRDLWVRVADDRDAEPVVKVDVLVAVDVPDAAALAVIDEDRLRRCVLERRRNASRQHLTRVVPELSATCARVSKTPLFDLDQLRDAVRGHLTGGSGRHGRLLACAEGRCKSNGIRGRSISSLL